MKKINSKDIVHIMREEYERKLVSQLNEMETFDSRGKLVIGKDLKVKHEPSGYIYTVRGIQGEPGRAKIVLRSPEEPRVQPPDGVAAGPTPAPAKALAKAPAKTPPKRPGDIHPAYVPPLQDEFMEDDDPETDDDEEDKKDYGKNAYPKDKPPPKQDVGENMFVIDQKEFEKYYREA